MFGTISLTDFLRKNLHFRYIKLSSPKLNNIAIAGTILFYGAVFLLGIDHATLLHESSFPIICMVSNFEVVISSANTKPD